MKQSESLKELFTALSKAQSQFKVAEKDAENPYFKSKYADFESIVSSCRPALSSNGLSFIQITHLKDDKSLILITRLCHSSGEYIESEYPIEPIKRDPQALGSALTYAKRYSLAALLGVVTSDEDDDGEAAVGRHQKQLNEPKKQIVNDAQVNQQNHVPKQYSEKEKTILNMRSFMASLGVTEQHLKDKFKLKNLFELTNDQINEIKFYAEEIKNGKHLNTFF